MFVYSLPIFFSDIAVLTPLEFFLIVLMLACFLWASSPLTIVDQVKSSHQFELRKFLLEAWMGLKPLWTVFWPFFLILNLVLYFVDSLARNGDFTVSSWDAVYFIFFTPILIWTLCIWRNSVNCSGRIWAGLARLMVLAVYFEYALKLVIRLDYSRIFFDCQGLTYNYMTCF